MDSKYNMIYDATQSELLNTKYLQVKHKVPYNRQEYHEAAEKWPNEYHPLELNHQLAKAGYGLEASTGMLPG